MIGRLIVWLKACPLLANRKESSYLEHKCSLVEELKAALPKDFDVSTLPITYLSKEEEKVVGQAIELKSKMALARAQLFRAAGGRTGAVTYNVVV